MPMREAITASNVPVYQELARRIGLERYRVWLARLNYGNRQAGTVVDRFWLDGPLEISAIEQARFVTLLAQKKLQASARSQSIVRDILQIENRDGAVLCGKTGWDGQIGWWTGWVEREGRVSAFSLNTDMQKIADAPKRVAIGKALLGKLRVL
jgi:beta-lactamase class D